VDEQGWADVLEIQGGVCAICGLSPETGARPLCVDHDHETDDVRGLLCPTCNGGLGMFRDDPALLVTAAQYLKFWSDGWGKAKEIIGQAQFWKEVQDGRLRTTPYFDRAPCATKLAGMNVVVDRNVPPGTLWLRCLSDRHGALR
jgi:hypothetical protein